MPSEYKCCGCDAEIPGINVKFGGTHHHTADGDLYCSKDCHNRHYARGMAIICGPDERYKRWMKGDDIEVEEAE